MPARPSGSLLDSGSRLLRPSFRRAATPSQQNQGGEGPSSSSSGSSMSHQRERLTPQFFTRNETLPWGYNEQPYPRRGAALPPRPPLAGSYPPGGPPPPGPPPPPPPSASRYEAPRRWVQHETERQDWYRPEMSQSRNAGGSGYVSTFKKRKERQKREQHEREANEMRRQQYSQYQQDQSQHPYHHSEQSQHPNRPHQQQQLYRPPHQRQPNPQQQPHSLPPRPPGSPRGSRSYHFSSGPSPTPQRSPPRQGSPSAYNRPRPLAVRAEPRQSYAELSSQSPTSHLLDMDPPGPPPLLVLDLNGTLVFRGASRSNNNAPSRRPYLSSFLAYCLGFEDASYAPDSLDHDEAAANQRRSEWKCRAMLPREEQNRSAPRPHGSHFWASSSSPSTFASTLPPSHPNSSFRLLVWSSAQPQNVDSMVRSMLHPQQAEQLVRCWGRDTLVPMRFYNTKAPSVKDLEIIWDALAGDKNGERRVMAEVRDREDRQSGVSTTERDDTMVPCLYGAHNTLLLDDSPSKARLQPYNHLLVPEFDGPRASAAEAYRNQARQDNKKAKGKSAGGRKVDSDEEDEGLEQVDTVLLQAVGVLEHARYQKNVAAWIRSGGLGRFAGVEQPGTSGNAVQSSTMDRSKECELEPNLDVPSNERTEAFWRREGRRALSRNQVALIF
ncbi:hypothetical protein BDZ90DRAFT_96792 [Jaminaea rosea]|uniref:FCP1 homology domain-containing protein n=1 Tax=Jaminaea rosea TaxID=1569628 RepID=A0A316UHV9_9BASI|nr:hypothetical protein BDZ90DRAFT_96792 [Jaminaea rosea]PWN24810.1 hypothetical protein BDZ90DRAFT_96792 [Jaminaea rosea]